MNSAWVNRAREHILEYMLRWASRRRVIRGVLGEYGFVKRTPRSAGRADRIRVALVQLELRPTTSVAGYVRAVAGPLAELDELDIDLIVYPEDTATHLLGLLPDFECLAEAPSVQEALRNVAGPGVSVADIFRFLGPATRRIYRETFSGLARLTGTWVVAGTAILPENDAVYNVAHVFDPQGRLAGTQRKLHLIDMERSWGLSPGCDLAPVQTSFGNLGVAVCMDATFYEPFRVLELKGAEVTAVPAANPEEYNVWRVLRGPWARAQDARMYVLHSCMVGKLAGLTITGRSAVYGPVGITPGGTGVVAQLEDPHAPGVLVADLDLAALRELRRTNPRPTNLQFYGRYLPGIYQAAGAPART